MCINTRNEEKKNEERLRRAAFIAFQHKKSTLNTSFLVNSLLWQIIEKQQLTQSVGLEEFSYFHEQEEQKNSRVLSSGNEDNDDDRSSQH